MRGHTMNGEQKGRGTQKGRTVISVRPSVLLDSSRITSATIASRRLRRPSHGQRHESKPTPFKRLLIVIFTDTQQPFYVRHEPSE